MRTSYFPVDRARTGKRVMFDLVVHGDLVLPDRVLRGGFLAVRGGVIGALGVGDAPAAAESVDATGHLIFPGVIDGQVHAGSAEGIAMASKVKWSPYDGMIFGARVTGTYVRGTEVYADGAVVAAPGTGTFVRPV